MTALALTWARSPSKIQCADSTPEREAQAIQTVPTGLSAVPPSGPAMPLMATAHAARECLTAPLAISHTTFSLTAPNRSMELAFTPRRSFFEWLE